MKKIFLLICAGLILTGCSTKEIIKKKTDSAEIQKAKAEKAWNELDKE